MSEYRTVQLQLHAQSGGPIAPGTPVPVEGLLTYQEGVVPWHNPLGDLSREDYGAWQANGVESYALSRRNLGLWGLATLREAGGPYGNPTWDAVNGWTCPGGLLSGIIPEPGCTLLVEFAGATQDAFCCVAGALDFSQFNGLVLEPRCLFTSGVRSFCAGEYFSGHKTVAPHVASGVLGIAGSQGYLDGEPCGDPVGAYTVAPSVELGLGGLYFGGGWQGVGQFVSIRKVFYHRLALDAVHVAAISAAMPTQ